MSIIRSNNQCWSENYSEAEIEKICCPMCKSRLTEEYGGSWYEIDALSGFLTSVHGKCEGCRCDVNIVLNEDLLQKYQTESFITWCVRQVYSRCLKRVEEYVSCNFNL